MRVAFAKLQGLGNDFVLLDARDAEVPTGRGVIRHLADRRLGVGCDQVLVLAPATAPGAAVDYRIFNATGDEVEHCGNGVRCVATYLHRRAELDVGGQLAVNAGGRRVGLELVSPDTVRVDMGRPVFEPQTIPLSRPERQPRYDFHLPDGSVVTGGAVSLGNPHVVIEVADVRGAPVDTVGPVMEAHADFPRRVNVGFLEFVDPERVRLRVFERGVGETPACGTGACAAVVVGRSWGRLERAVAVELSGGTLEVEWSGEDDDTVSMTGPAEFVFEGRIEL